MPEETPGGRGKTIQSVESALAVVEVIRRKERAGVTEIANELDRSKSTVHHYVTTLVKHDYLEKVDGEYQLSLRFLTLGGQVREREQLYHLGKDDVDKLAQETGEQARLIVERNGSGITLYQATGNRVTEPITHVGSIEALYCTAAGKVFLAELSDEELDSYLDSVSITPYTENTITDADKLRGELDKIQDRGVAFDDEERYEGYRCVASAISTEERELFGALSVSAPIDRMNEERFRTDIPNQLQNVAGVVEINTTYSEWTDVL
ncbi:IclR family transcriptional regulator [Natrialba taiwanensis]|uniref:Transcriptional regulator, IclR family protein n=1 Tax=Natrialba taiwanensis DSM 12281 TaxID=1230458 RepID=M0AEC2_9EURY|nr:IclR family transcriptional regulator [Natrialba taiwanensis]ELY96884.1 transcriptional regulator, IclR family protein [Natrialba taiwanensis DSM 12281]